MDNTRATHNLLMDLKNVWIMDSTLKEKVERHNTQEDKGSILSQISPEEK